MKRLLRLLGIIILISTEISIASEIYHTQKLGNGQVINWCRYNNGKVDYCTQQDALRAMDVVNNPRKYMSKEELAKFDKAINIKEARMNSVFPLYKQSINKNNAIKKEIRELEYKESLGISVDTKKLELLNYKSSIIYYLNDTIMLDGNSSAYGINNVHSKYEDLFEALDRKNISQSEYNEAVLNLEKQADNLQFIFNKGMALTSVPNENALYWVELNYPNLKSNANALQNPVTMMPSSVKTKLNTLKTIKDTAQEFGIKF